MPGEPGSPGRANDGTSRGRQSVKVQVDQEPARELGWEGARGQRQTHETQGWRERGAGSHKDRREETETRRDNERDRCMKGGDDTEGGKEGTERRRP